MEVRRRDAPSSSCLFDPIPDRFDRGVYPLEPGGRAEPPRPDALVFEAGTRRGRGLRHGESHGSRRRPGSPMERTDSEMVRDRAGAAGGMRNGQLLLPYLWRERRGGRNGPELVLPGPSGAPESHRPTFSLRMASYR